MKKNCDNCYYYEYDMETETHTCLRYDCFCNEVAKEIENPSCWESMKEVTYEEIFGSKANERNLK